MKNKRLFLGAISSTLAATLLVAAVSGVRNFGFSLADPTSYTLTFDSTHKIVDSQILTTSGNTIWAKNGGVEFGDNLTFDAGDYIQNLSALKGIKNVKINLVSGSVQVMHGYYEPSDLTSLMYYDETVTTTKTVAMDAVNMPDYVRIIANEATVLGSIAIEYCCANDTDKKTITNIDYEYEMGEEVFGDAITSIVEDGILSNECIRAVPLYEKGDNPSVSINIAECIEDGLMSAEGTADFLTFDIKDDAGVIENNSRYGIPAQVVAKDGATGWMDTLNWGGTEIADGWYRFHYSLGDLRGVKMTDIQKVNIFFSKGKKSSSGTNATEFLIDNVKLSENPMNQDKFRMFKSKDAYDITGLNAEANKLPSSVEFEVQRISGSEIRFFVGNSWGDNFGYYTIAADNTTDNTNVIATAIKNGWVKVHVNLRELNRSGTKNTTEFTLLDIRNSGDSQTKVALGSIRLLYDDPVTLNAGDRLLFENPITIADYEGLSFEYAQDNGGNLALNTKVILKTDNNKYIGDYTLTGDYTGNAGVVVTDLTDGYKRLTFTFADINRTNASWNAISADMTQLLGIESHSSWGDKTPISIRNITFIPKA